jgi:signal transduction histidine kinase
MTLRSKLALRYGAIIGVCLLLLGGLAYHEFVTEPRQRQIYKIPELPEMAFTEWVEVFCYGMIPVVLAAGWWIMRKTLAPLCELAHNVERIHADNLREPLRRTGNGDEVDRLTEVFNGMTARLNHSFQQIREFTLHASHELKTPLTIMRVQLETMLEEDQALSPAQVEWLECELNEVQRMSKIVDSLALLTKAEAGLVKLEQQEVTLGGLVRECFEDAQILAEPQSVRVTLADCEATQISGDRDRLRQLLLNLTDNAIKYNRPGGSVTLALRQRDGQAEIEITNTGEGVPPELQARVFDRFVRGEEARSRAIEGSGLGLSISRWIVGAHGGTIEMTSRAGQSTTVTVRLPLAQPVA